MECRRSDWNMAENNLQDMGFHIDDSPLRDLFDNGAAQYLIDAYTNSIINDLGDDTIEKLTPHQTIFIKERLKGLYAFLKNHPALMDRRLKVGSKKPTIPNQTLRPNDHEKRTFQHFTAQSVCPSSTNWRLLRYARDMNDTEVEVFQPTEGNEGFQWFYTVSCNEQHKVMTNPVCPGCCRGINRRRVQRKRGKVADAVCDLRLSNSRARALLFSVARLFKLLKKQKYALEIDLFFFT
ncbi:hypothetical protein LOTGIDRAFT_161061 [Lottia gigantea]|uniref:Uncharacterized protein n=1 Tax=Lottia gigantea TaxID=225164 RepID=V4C060_LOTGI|nr:hypothetical protein LOTGIDRAFT_161061 [Lottia gigantea]ESO94809.1 hypothetical protein LOTGIDRAFT_161061 [Lottia gigantea]